MWLDISQHIRSSTVIGFAYKRIDVIYVIDVIHFLGSLGKKDSRYPVLVGVVVRG